jgi:hypothetical protein
MQRPLDLGATLVRAVRDPATGALWWTSMQDVEGNEFCALPPVG